MNDFASLSLNDKYIPPFLPEIQETNKILESKSIEDLMINIYLYDNPFSSFEELQQKMIDFYILEANEECILTHFISITEILSEIEFNYINDNLLYIYYDENDFHLQFNIKFITSIIGTKYLNDIYIKKCLII
jgi:hypothetical protein